MNKDKIKKLIKVLEETTTFDQSRFVHNCGTPACLSGHTVGMEDDWEICISVELDEVWAVRKGDTALISIADAAMAILGISFRQSMDLFSGWPFYDETLELATPAKTEDAIATLKYLLKTGKVQWQRAR